MAANKSVRKGAKKALPKKPAAKGAAKKPAAKAAAKKALPKKPAAKSASKKPAKAAPAPKKPAAKVAPRIARKPVAPKPGEESATGADTAKAIAFAMSIAKEKKNTAAADDQRRAESQIRLTKRPTTRAQGKTTVKFPAADLKEFRRRLLEARAKAMNGVNAMKATGFNESEDHEADGGDGTNQTLRLQALGQMGTINRTIQQIEEALHRIDDGSYGVCTVCGQLIRKPRLINQPFVLTCMECQSEMERGR